MALSAVRLHEVNILHQSTRKMPLKVFTSYSNGKGLTKTLYNRERAPAYSEELRARMEEAFRQLSDSCKARSALP